MTLHKYRGQTCPHSQNIREALVYHSGFQLTPGQSAGLDAGLSSFDLRNFSTDKYSAKGRDDGCRQRGRAAPGSFARIRRQRGPGHSSAACVTACVTAKHPNSTPLIFFASTAQPATHLLLRSAAPGRAGESLTQGSGG